MEHAPVHRFPAAFQVIGAEQGEVVEVDRRDRSFESPERRRLKAIGVIDPDDASVLIVNTCGFIESARQESIGALQELAESLPRTDFGELDVEHLVVESA